jgi:hypothetical protein
MARESPDPRTGRQNGMPPESHIPAAAPVHNQVQWRQTTFEITLLFNPFSINDEISIFMAGDTYALKFIFEHTA